MAASFTVMLTVSLLALAGTEVSGEKNCSTLGTAEAAKLTDKVQGIADALKCFGCILEDAMRVQKEINDTVAYLEMLPDKVNSLTQDNKNLKNRIASKDRKIEDLEDKLKRAEQQLVKYSENEKRQNQTLHQLEEQCKEKIDVDSDKIRGLEDDLKQATKELSDKEKLLIDTVHDLQEQCKEKDNDNIEKITDLEDDLKQAHKDLSEKEKLMMDTVTDLEGKLMHAKKQLSTEKKRLAQTVRNLEAAEKELKTEVEKNKKQMKELQDELKEAREQLKECSANEKLLNKTVDQVNAEKAELDREVEMRDEKVNQLTAANGDLESKLDNADEEVRKLKEECDKKNEENIEKTREVEDKLDQCLQEKENFSKSEKRLKDMVNQLTAANGDLESKLDNADEETREVEDKLDQCLQEKENLSKSGKRLKDRIHELYDECNKKTEVSDNKVLDLRRDLEECQRKADELTEDLKRKLQCNDKVKPGASPEECVHREGIAELVQQFLSTRSWGQLRRGLEAVLDHCSEEYHQVQSVEYGDDHPLLWIGRNGLTKLASLLLCGGLPVDIVATARGGAMLDVAAEAGQLDFIQLLLDHGADVNAKRGGLRMTPLMWAAQGGHQTAVRHLLQAGAERAVRRIDGSTALDLAEFFGRTGAAEELKSFQS